MTNEEFSTLMEQYERLVFTVCYQMVRDYHDAQNLTQETFLSAYRHLTSCPADSWKPWLTRIAANKAKDYLKSAYQRHVTPVSDDTFCQLPAPDTPDAVYVAGEGEQKILDQIESLQEPYLKVARLYFAQERSVEEITELLHRPKKTVQTQIYRARLQLRALLQEARKT